MEKIIKLEYPVEYEKDGAKLKLEEVKLTRLKGKHIKSLMGAEKTSHESVMVIIASMNGLPVSVIEELDVDDIAKISKELESFLPKSQVA